MAPDDGGPAFPRSDTQEACTYGSYTEGMTLRDYFAGQALAGLAGNSTVYNSAADEGVEPPTFREELAKGAYRLADAMLAARKAGG